MPVPPTLVGGQPSCAHSCGAMLCGWPMHLQARILFVNPVSKEVGLSLLPHLVGLTLPSPIPMLGQVRLQELAGTLRGVPFCVS